MTYLTFAIGQPIMLRDRTLEGGQPVVNLLRGKVVGFTPQRIRVEVTRAGETMRRTVSPERLVPVAP